jgi:WD40 repeat protein/energy-coupling factor transporter ATP-binding protein EcfA2
MPDPAMTDCPYPGLRAYSTGERDWYFGREEHVDAMLSRLEESPFLAIVGSSGSGKSSLVFAGLIPALIDGQLGGSKRDSNGEAVPWNVICFNPGNDPLSELTAAIVNAAAKKDDPHIAGYVRAALESAGGLIEALKVAEILDAERETLIYADQFEEFFRFGEKASRAAQENALRFARLFVAAAEQTEVRFHMLLSMRSEFIGQCEAFPGLPELVSRSQFLAPRLSRKQLERSLACPAAAVGWELAPDALTAILNDCGNSPDQLPLAQHILRRMWKRAARAQRQELTLDDYVAEGDTRKSIAAHGQDILNELPQPAGTAVTRVLFMALCEQREDGPLVRRLSTRSEVEAIAGDNSALVPDVITAFAKDDPGFIQENDGWLDVRHEAVLRQWPLISQWRTLEGESETWLHELSQAATHYIQESGRTELWRGNDLREAELWFDREKPSEAWAIRHGVENWSACVRFLENSWRAAIALEEDQKAEALAAQKTKERRQRIWVYGTGAIALAMFLIGLVMFTLWKNAASSREAAENAAASIAAAAEDIVKTGTSALNEAEELSRVLIVKIRDAALGPAPDQDLAKRVFNARRTAEDAVRSVENLLRVSRHAMKTSDKPGPLSAQVKRLEQQVNSVRQRLDALEKSPDALDVMKDSIEARLARAEAALSGLTGILELVRTNQPLVAATIREKQAELDAVAADYAVIDAIQGAAAAFGFDINDFKPFASRIAVIANFRQAINQSEVASGMTVEEWRPDRAVALRHTGKVKEVHFSPIPDKVPKLAATCEAPGVWFWKADGTLVSKQNIANPVDAIAVSPAGDALAAADRNVVLVDRGAYLLTFRKATSFTQHKDSITDLEFSHGGERIASASLDRTVRVFDSRSMKELSNSQALPAVVTAVQFHRGDNLLVSGSEDGGVRLHTIDVPSIRVLGTMGAAARLPEFSYDGKFILAASADTTARVWPLVGSGEVVNVSHSFPVTQATFRPVIDAKGYTFVTCAMNGEVQFVRMTDATASSAQSTKQILKPHHPGPALSASWSADGKLLATVGGGEVLIWEMSTDVPTARVRLAGLHDTSRAEFSHDSKFLVTYGGDDTALVWDVSKIAPAAAY